MPKPRSGHVRPNGSKIKEILNTKGLYLEEVVKRTKLSSRVIDKVVAGQPVEIATLEAIARAIDETYGDLVAPDQQREEDTESDVSLPNFEGLPTSMANEEPRRMTTVPAQLASSAAVPTHDDRRRTIEFVFNGDCDLYIRDGRIQKILADVMAVRNIAEDGYRIRMIFAGNSVHIVLDMDKDDAEEMIKAFRDGRLAGHDVAEVRMLPTPVEITKPSSDDGGDPLFRDGKWAKEPPHRKHFLRRFWKWGLFLALTGLISALVIQYINTQNAHARRLAKQARIATAVLDQNWPPHTLLFSGYETLVEAEKKEKSPFTITLRRTSTDVDGKHRYEGVYIPLNGGGEDCRLTSAIIERDNDTIYIFTEYPNSHLEWPELTYSFGDDDKEEALTFDITINRQERTFSGTCEIGSNSKKTESQLRGKLNF
jgi:transcriptional regulator with XRE-family HTH domain